MDKIHKCDVCGKENVEGVVCASSMGPITFSYCKDCFEKGLEPYNAVVAYISCSGHFPQDINETYQGLVRSILEGLGKSEEEFIRDVDKTIEELNRNS